jgi:hypothetical protein
MGLIPAAHNLAISPAKPLLRRPSPAGHRELMALLAHKAHPFLNLQKPALTPPYQWKNGSADKEQSAAMVTKEFFSRSVSRRGPKAVLLWE